MIFLEKDLEQIIFETDNKNLRTRNLFLRGHKKRQLRIGNYGISDIVYFHRDNELIGESNNYQTYPFMEITVCELKQNKIDANTLMQAIKYCKGIEYYILNHRKKEIDIRFKIILIGKEICKGEFIYFPDFIDNIQLYTYSYQFDGIFFKEHKGYSLVNPGF